MRAESWEWINPKWWPSENQTENTPELLPRGENNSHNRKQLWEDGIKLEPWIFRRIDHDLIKRNLFLGLLVENNNEKHHPELLRHSRIMKNIKVESTIKRIWKILEKDIWLMIIHSYVKLGKEFKSHSEKIEDSDKILGKDLWVRAHSKDTPLNDYLKGRLHRLNWIAWMR